MVGTRLFIWGMFLIVYYFKAENHSTNQIKRNPLQFSKWVLEKLHEHKKLTWNLQQFKQSNTREPIIILLEKPHEHNKINE